MNTVIKNNIPVVCVISIFFIFFASYFVSLVHIGEAEKIEAEIVSMGATHSATGSTIYFVAKVEDGRIFRFHPIDSSFLKVGDKVELELNDRMLFFSDQVTLIRKM